MTFYVGMTNNLARRIVEHKAGEAPSFTKLYNVIDLVYFDAFQTPTQAIAREKKLKTWHRQWKLDLIKEFNPTMRDMYEDIL
jgi:putative endonuclease|tara:strand:- start:28 stop:273 length:246 start_codon:yes stop_codon:yes gene_type:complete